MKVLTRMIFDIHPVPVSIQEDCWSVEWNWRVVRVLSFLILAGLIQGCILIQKKYMLNSQQSSIMFKPV